MSWINLFAAGVSGVCAIGIGILIYMSETQGFATNKLRAVQIFGFIVNISLMALNLWLYFTFK